MSAAAAGIGIGSGRTGLRGVLAGLQGGLAGLHGLVLALLVLMLAGCAHRPAAPDAASTTTTGRWSGRLALQVEDAAAQSFSAGFELRGDARAGELTLFNPLGGTLALLAWAPGSATLRTGSQVQAFDSIDALSAQAIGTAVPMAALFDWLAGTPTPVTGWQPDLSQLAAGRLLAARLSPAPRAWLRLALER